MVKYKNIGGFTLIELIVVIAIIAILAGTVIIRIGESSRDARDSRRISDLNKIKEALERFRIDRGYYPQSGCGWDCNGYRYSYNSSWDSLASDLEPYINLPKDPKNSPNCSPWTVATNCYTYVYGNVGRNTYNSTYDLVARLENPNHSQRCGISNYRLYFNNQPWCIAFGGSYSNQIYEASP